jgi:hypothetical protein
MGGLHRNTFVYYNNGLHTTLNTQQKRVNGVTYRWRKKMINEHDIKIMHEENKDKQPKPKEVEKVDPALEFSLKLQEDQITAALLATIPFGSQQ